MNAHNGGPAFPVDTRSTGSEESGDYGHQTGNITWQFPGMTLRDYFAAKADIPWEVAAEVVYRQNGNANGTLTQIMRKRSQLCFEQADEMLVERAK